jgi:hypothetical protein
VEKAIVQMAMVLLALIRAALVSRGPCFLGTWVVEADTSLLWECFISSDAESGRLRGKFTDRWTSKADQIG